MIGMVNVRQIYGYRPILSARVSIVNKHNRTN